MQPVSPLIAIAIALAISRIEMPESIARVALLTLLVVQTGAWLPQTIRYVQNDTFAMLMRDDDPMTAGKWIHEKLPSDLTLATSRLGAISVTNMDRTIWDFDGLTDREQALFNLHHGTGESPIAQRHPDVIVEADVPAEWSYRRDTTGLRQLETTYTMIAKFKQGRMGTLDVWLLKADSLRIFAAHDH
jgi:hypothetical protein